jgi:hypothetical protein
MKKEDWIWMPHAAHHCQAHNMKFHLATFVGGVIVSTVGELVENRGNRMTRMEEGDFDLINADSLYETMVFKARNQDNPEGMCCPYIIIPGLPLETIKTNNNEMAYVAHMDACQRWSDKSYAEQGIKKAEDSKEEWEKYLEGAHGCSWRLLPRRCDG